MGVTRTPNFQLRLGVAIAVTALAVCFAAAGCRAQPRTAELTILYTNDIHGHQFPFDYDKLGKDEKAVGGAARRVALIRTLRSSTRNAVLVMDAGDFFTRGPLEEFKGEPDMAIMNAVPYNCMTLGNEDIKGFGGLDVLSRRLKQAAFPVVSANTLDKSTNKPIAAPYHIFDCKGLKVAVFGLTTQVVNSYKEAAGLEIADPVATARHTIAELEGKADVIIALTHLGYPNDLELAMSAPGIDVIIGGHSHTWIFQPTLVKSGWTGGPSRPNWWVGGTIVCQDGEWGKCVGRLDLTVRLAAGHGTG